MKLLLKFNGKMGFLLVSWVFNNVNIIINKLWFIVLIFYVLVRELIRLMYWDFRF